MFSSQLINTINDYCILLGINADLIPGNRIFYFYVFYVKYLLLGKFLPTILFLIIMCYISLSVGLINNDYYQKSGRGLEEYSKLIGRDEYNNALYCT